MKACIVCGRPTPEAASVCIELRPDEEAALIQAGVEAPGPLTYCNSCWTILKDPSAAPQLIRSAAERVMLRYGVGSVKAKAAADRLYSRLLELQRLRQHKTH